MIDPRSLQFLGELLKLGLDIARTANNPISEVRKIRAQYRNLPSREVEAELDDLVKQGK